MDRQDGALERIGAGGRAAGKGYGVESAGDFWGEPIHVYTRSQALADGVLFDVTETAREAGFSLPTAITAAVSADVAAQGDREGRLWDLLWMGVHAVRMAKAIDQQDRHLDSLGVPRGSRAQSADEPEFVYALIMPVGEANNYRAKLHIGPGDDGKPVLSVMRSEED